MQFDWWTLALQGINFLVLAWLLQRFLYRPVKRVIEQRRELAEKAFKEADQAKAAAEAERKALSDAREQLTAEREELLRRLHAEAETERARASEAAKAEADRVTEEARADIASERKQTLDEVRGEITGLATDLAATLLRRSAAAMPGGVYLQQIEHEFARLPAEERSRLQRELAREDARLTVITALPLSDAEQAEWSAWLQQRIGNVHATDFVCDESIIGGVELRFPHAVLRYTWADQLERAKAALSGEADHA